MGTWTITTTTPEDEAIAYAYQQSQRPMLGAPPTSAPPAAETEAEFFQRMVAQFTIAPMVTRHTEAKNTELVESLNTIPEANRPAAKTDIENVITTHGGTVPLHDTRYGWSASTAPPPRRQSVEVDATEANFQTLSKVFFDYQDGDGINQMAKLLALKIGTLIRIEDPGNAANFLQFSTTGTPVQRQGADGHVEISARFSQHGGSFAALDTHLMTCTFS